MPLPQGMTLQRGFGDHTVWVVGPGGRYALKNPAEAAKLVGPGWANEIQDVMPGSYEGVPEFGSMDQALRAPPTGQQNQLGTYGGKAIGAPSDGRYDFASAYNRANNYNQQLYGNILGGYQQVLRDQQQAQQQVQQGYGDLRNSVMGQLNNVEAAQRQSIADDYARAQAQGMQSMASRGLGNTTVTDSMGRGLLADKSRADSALSGQMGQMRAGFESDLGMAGLGYGQQAIRDNAALAGSQFDWMGSTKMDLPNSAQYAGIDLDAKSLSLQGQQLDAQHQGGSVGAPNGYGGSTIVSWPGTKFRY